MAIYASVYVASKHSGYLPSFVSILSRCILESNTIARFLPPLGEEVTEWWQDQLKEAAAPDTKRVIIMAFDSVESGKDDRLVGYVILSDISRQTGPFRASVETLMVDPSVRRKGVGRALMEKLDEVAWAKGLWLLLLETETGSPAELFYPTVGYQLIGNVPEYAVSPVDSSLKDATFFYKDLRKTKA